MKLSRRQQLPVLRGSRYLSMSCLRTPKGGLHCAKSRPLPQRYVQHQSKQAGATFKVRDFHKKCKLR